MPGDVAKLGSGFESLARLHNPNAKAAGIAAFVFEQARYKEDETFWGG